MKIITLLVLICAICSVVSADVPPETIVQWFDDDCNRQNQVKAFETIIEYRTGSMYANIRMVSVKSEYDTPAIRAAFEGFVRSISVDYDISPCVEYITDPAIWDFEFDINYEPDGWPGLGGQFLSLFYQWGFDDLYPVAVKLAYGNDDAYYAFVWNELGTGFFQYLQNEVILTDENNIGIVLRYLLNFEAPSPEMVTACVDVLHQAAISPFSATRTMAGDMMVRLYVKGFVQFRADIIILLQDPVLNVKNTISRRIIFQQNYGRMLDFQLPQE